jgi:phosphoglycolate phosphatase-like HAD superfamily hydrolase
MDHSFDGYIKTHDFLICVDSDGTVMDTMMVKHSRCLAPSLIEEWGLQKWEEPVRKLWYDINIYGKTRGVNRFQALAIALRTINDSYTPIEDLPVLEAWVSSGGTLSGEALKGIAAENHNIILQKALAWTEAVNSKIGTLSLDEKKPFPGAHAGLWTASGFADIAVISTANRDALLTEWGKYGLLKYADIVLGQESGNKERCISRLVQEGYAPDHVLMVGDAPGDLDAARKNSVYFYPIIARHEEESWTELCTNGYAQLRGTTYNAYEHMKVRAFFQNLGSAQ